MLRRPFESAQYASGDYRKLIRLHGIKASMSRKGNGLDKVRMESVFRSLKTEIKQRPRFVTWRDARASLIKSIKTFHNRQRRHSSIGYRTPAQARMDSTIAQAA